METTRSLVDSNPGSWTLAEWRQLSEGIKYWKRQHTPRAVDMAWGLLDRAVKEEEENNRDRDSPLIDAHVHTGTLNGIVFLWNQHGPGKMSARDVLSRLEQYRLIMPALRVNLETYRMIMVTAIENGEENAHNLAEDILKLLVDGVEDNPLALPNTVIFTIAIDAIGKSGAPDAPQRAEALLQQMKDLSAKGWDKLKPSNKTYNAVISTWAHSRQPRAAHRAEELLRESPYPNTLCFNIVMDAWAKSDLDGSADRCIQIFQHMKKLNDSGVNLHVKPTSISYGIAIAALAKNGRAKEAEMVVQDLLNQYQATKDPFMIPDRVLFNALIDGWAKSGEKGAAQRAEAILEKMNTLAKQTNNPEMVPNSISFNSVLHGWAKSNDPIAASRAEAILDRMNDLERSGVPGVKPGLITYCTVLDCLANSRSKDAASRAEAVLELMIERYNSGDNDLKPNSVAFNTVINAFSKSRGPDAAAKAETMFSLMKSCGVQPNSTTFNSLISAWTNSRDSRAAAKAEGYLDEMKRLYKAGDEACKPNTTTYSAVINAWSTSRDPTAVEMARAVLDEMNLLADAGDLHCKPNVITYTSLLNVVARSKSEDRATTAIEILSEMEEGSIKPNERTFGSVLMSCAFSHCYGLATRTRAFKIAVHIILRAHHETKPSRDTFCFFFQSAAGLGHDTTVEMVYRWCAEAGLENDELIRRDVMKAAPHLLDKSSRWS